jgi:putative drug exporter of the RND superfamily
MDATLIRGTLVPAFMRLAGQANWWAPKFLRRVHDRFGFAEAPEEPMPATVPAMAGAVGGAAGSGQTSGDGQAAETPVGDPRLG